MIPFGLKSISSARVHSATSHTGEPGQRVQDAPRPPPPQSVAPLPAQPTPKLPDKLPPIHAPTIVVMEAQRKVRQRTMGCMQCVQGALLSRGQCGGLMCACMYIHTLVCAWGCVWTEMRLLHLWPAVPPKSCLCGQRLAAGGRGEGCCCFGSRWCAHNAYMLACIYLLHVLRGVSGLAQPVLTQPCAVCVF